MGRVSNLTFKVPGHILVLKTVVLGTSASSGTLCPSDGGKKRSPGGDAARDGPAALLAAREESIFGKLELPSRDRRNQRPRASATCNRGRKASGPASRSFATGRGGRPRAEHERAGHLRLCVRRCFHFQPWSAREGWCVPSRRKCKVPDASAGWAGTMCYPRGAGGTGRRA